MTRPVWLLDVDGVINMHGWAASKIKVMWGDTERVNVIGFPIVYSPTMLKRIRTMHDNGMAEVRWLTTWEDQANADLAPSLGFMDDLVVSGRREESQLERPRKFSESRQSYREDVGWWKLEFAQAVYDSGVPVVWTDDDIVYATDAVAWLNTTDPARMCWVAPNSGLTPDDLTRIEQFIQGHQT